MKKFRGRRKYYRKLSTNVSSFKLDLAEDHWYDMWHEHVDWYGIGNESRKARHTHLQALFTLFRNFQMQLESCNRLYQTFVLAYKNESQQDAVYLHTPNPNADNFPLVFEEAIADKGVPEFIKEFIDKTNYEIGHITFDGDVVYVIYSKQHGIPPIGS